jgi:YaiO family outer membrane protein
MMNGKTFPRILLSMFLLTAALPACGQDYDSLIQQALQQRNDGNFAAAEATLWQAYELAADKSEVSYLLGLVLAYQGLYSEALTLIDEGLAAAPNDSNLLTARAQVLEMRLASNSTASASGGAPGQQFTVGGSRSTIDLAGFADWNDRFVEYRNVSTDGGQQYLRAEHNHRFGLHDTMLEGGLRLLPGAALPLDVAVGFTPSDDFMPEYFARIGASKLIAEDNDSYGAVVFTGQYQHSSYANGRTNRLLAGLEYYLPGVDFWLTPSIGVVRDQAGTHTFAWSIGANWQVTGASRIGINYSDAPETENLLTTDTQAWGAYWQLELSQRVRVFLGYSRIDRVNAYVRESADLALQLRF